MAEIPKHLKFTETHEWLEVQDDGTATLGISDYAQSMLGDLVYVEPPEVGTTFDAGDSCSVVESVKAASDVYSPVSGEVIEVNEKLADEPELINTDPYNEGWIFRIRLTDQGELDNMMDANRYAEILEDEQD